MNKLVIIVGAGASAALAPRKIPVMNNFFEIAADFAQGDKQVAKTLKALRQAGFIGNGSMPKGNLEDVLERTLSQPRDSEDPWQRPYDGLLLTLQRIFHTLDQKYEISEYMNVLSVLSMVPSSEVAFISFNYDVFLERALARLLGWSAGGGYGHRIIAGYIELEQAEQTQKEARYDYEKCDEVYAWPKNTSHVEGQPVVLKPHGSLNWFIHNGNKGPFWIPKDSQGILLMRSRGGESRIPMFWDYPTTNMVKGEFARKRRFPVGTVLPAVIPPGKKFSRDIPVFQRIQVQIEETLVQASTLVFIGWSMTESDRQYEDLFYRVRSRRDDRLTTMAVCNYHQRKEFYHRFEKLLPAHNFLHCDNGFISTEAKGLFEELIKMYLRRHLA